MGKNQLVFLEALYALETEHGARWFSLREIVAQVFATSVGDSRASMPEGHDHPLLAALREAAARGNQQAAEALSRQADLAVVTRSLSWRPGRKITATARAEIPPVSALDSLHKRGHVELHSGQARLTEDGRRAFGARRPMRQA